MDKPNDRSLHETPVPRSGGIGMLLGIGGGWAIAGAYVAWPVWTAIALVIAISLTDDLRAQGLPAMLRLGAHLVAAFLVAMTMPALNQSLTYGVMGVLCICWMCNLYNFMDGSDGLAGGMAMFGFGAYAIAAAIAGHAPLSLLSLSVAAAAAGFLLHNFHPARIFLGDAGSVPLGFLAAVLGLVGWTEHIWPLWFPLMVFSPFIVDASVTLARRVFAGAAIWQAHRDHYYQRLVQMGWGHRRTALSAYVLMAICGAVAISGLQSTPTTQLGLATATAAIYAGLIASVEITWRNSLKARRHDS